MVENRPRQYNIETRVGVGQLFREVPCHFYWQPCLTCKRFDGAGAHEDTGVGLKRSHLEPFTCEGVTRDSAAGANVESMTGRGGQPNAHRLPLVTAPIAFGSIQKWVVVVSVVH